MFHEMTPQVIAALRKTRCRNHKDAANKYAYICKCISKKSAKELRDNLRTKGFTLPCLYELIVKNANNGVIDSIGSLTAKEVFGYLQIYKPAKAKIRLWIKD